MIDRRVVAIGAAVALAILVPPIVVLRALLGSEEDSPLWTLVPLVFLVAFTVAGGITARRAPRSPLAHAGVVGGVAFGIALLGGVVRNLLGGWSMRTAALISALLFWQIATSLSMLGGFIAVRRRSRAMEVEQP